MTTFPQTAPSAAASPIGRMLRPRSIAIVGASPTPGALGAKLLANLERNGFAGAIHLINPKRAQINGRACLASVDDLPEGVDVAVLAIPQPAVLDAVRALARRKAGAVVIFPPVLPRVGPKGWPSKRRWPVLLRRRAWSLKARTAWAALITWTACR